MARVKREDSSNYRIELVAPHTEIPDALQGNLFAPGAKLEADKSWIERHTANDLILKSFDIDLHEDRRTMPLSRGVQNYDWRGHFGRPLSISIVGRCLVHSINSN